MSTGGIHLRCRFSIFARIRSRLSEAIAREIIADMSPLGRSATAHSTLSPWIHAFISAEQAHIGPTTALALTRWPNLPFSVSSHCQELLRGKMARYLRIGFREFWKSPRRIRILKTVHLRNGSVISIFVMEKCGRMSLFCRKIGRK